MGREELSRRDFLERSVLWSGAASAAMSIEERTLLAAASGDAPPPAAAPTAGDLPRGKIGDLRLGRLICGGNLISGSAHARDLVYVSTLLKHYFTDEKACETLALCEKSGMDAMILRVDAQILRVLKRYRTAGGAMRWIAQAKPLASLDLETDIRIAAENGAVGAYLQGQVADRLAAGGGRGSHREIPRPRPEARPHRGRRRARTRHHRRVRRGEARARFLHEDAPHEGLLVRPRT